MLRDNICVLFLYCVVHLLMLKYYMFYVPMTWYLKVNVTIRRGGAINILKICFFFFQNDNVLSPWYYPWLLCIFKVCVVNYSSNFNYVAKFKGPEILFLLHYIFVYGIMIWKIYLGLCIIYVFFLYIHFSSFVSKLSNASSSFWTFFCCWRIFNHYNFFCYSFHIQIKNPRYIFIDIYVFQTLKTSLLGCCLCINVEQSLAKRWIIFVYCSRDWTRTIFIIFYLIFAW